MKSRRNSLSSILIILLVAALMEPITAYTHKLVMHKTLWVWHKSHHQQKGTPFELNDLFPVVFSFLSILLFVIGMQRTVFTDIAIGITLYGFTYFVVHEIIIHSRFIKIKSRNKLFTYWRFSHNVHHQFNREPYGFIVPLTPKNLAEKAHANPRDLIDRF
jgi:beta-carotene 3-hydroxylase